MVLQVMVADNVVVDERVALRTEVPRLLLGIVRSVLKARQLVLEVEHVVSLLVAEGAILVLGEHIDELFMLFLAILLFTLLVSENLRNRVVTCLHSLHHLVGDFQVRVGFTLELSFLSDVVTDVFAPALVVSISREEHLVRRCLHNFLVLSGKLNCHY